MKLCLVIFVMSVTAVAAGWFESAYNVCEGMGRMVRQFNGRKEDTKMPCKYNAVHQQCGKYIVNLTPGNVYLHPNYRLDSLWMAIKEVSSHGNVWEGRTDNKKAIKFFNNWSSELFTKKSGDAETEDILVYGKDGQSTWAEAKNGDFRVTFIPWDPENSAFSMSSWSFECFSDDFQATGYPAQICGGEDRLETAVRNEELGLEGREQVIYYDVFTNSDIVQTNPKCANATRIMTEECTEAQRRLAIITCSQILWSRPHTKCVTKYTCDPMDVFVDCIDWVCSDFNNNNACKRVARGIDLCRKFTGGDLSAKVQNAKCYREFLPIIK